MPPRTADSLDLITPRLVAWEKSEAAARSWVAGWLDGWMVGWLVNGYW